MAATIPSAALVALTPAFTNTERLALAGFLAGYSGLTRQAYELDLRQYASWCQQHQALFQTRRTDIECFARDLKARGRARATITRRLCTIAGFYRYAVEEDLLDHHAFEADNAAMPLSWPFPVAPAGSRVAAQRRPSQRASIGLRSAPEASVNPTAQPLDGPGMLTALRLPLSAAGSAGPGTVCQHETTPCDEAPTAKAGPGKAAVITAAIPARPIATATILRLNSI